MTDLRGKSIVVTGASSGIGAAVVGALAAEGARLTIGARRVDRLDALARELGGDVVAVATDMRVEADVVRLVATARERFGGVDALVNNAGLGRQAPVSSGTTELWREMLETNVLGLLIATREAVQDMERRAVAGHVVHVSSMAGHPRARSRLRRVCGQKPPSAPLPKGSARSSARGRARSAYRACRRLRRHRVHAVFVGPGPRRRVTHVRSMPVDVARAIVWVLTQPPHMEVHDVLVRPTGQRN
jgi:NADP-dependent 3-hydroxy acid dehydrogenase YdfG